MRTDARGMWCDVRLVPPPLNTPLLVWDGDTILHAIKCVAYVGEIYPEWIQVGDGEGKEMSLPTHWRHMPLPPT